MKHTELKYVFKHINLQLFFFYVVCFTVVWFLP